LVRCSGLSHAQTRTIPDTSADMEAGRERGDRDAYERMNACSVQLKVSLTHLHSPPRSHWGRTWRRLWAGSVPCTQSSRRGPGQYMSIIHVSRMHVWRTSMHVNI
jgi:hypothetical protein